MPLQPFSTINDSCWSPFDLEPSQSSRRTNSKQKASAKRDRDDSVPSKPPRIFFFGQNRELALYRADFLERMGYAVILPETKAEAVSVIRNVPFDVAILSYTLSDTTVKELADLIRQACPDCPLLTIAKSATNDPHIQPDAIVKAEAGPSGLASALRNVLTKQVQ